MRAVAGDHKLALRVILGELSSVHQQVCALLEAVVEGQRYVRVCLSATMDVLLRNDLSLGLTKQLAAQFSEDQPDGWVLVVWVASKETTVDLINCDGQWLRMIPVNYDFAHAVALEIMLIGQVVVNDLLVIVANCGDVKELDVISKCDPESTVVTFLQVHLALS